MTGVILAGGSSSRMGRPKHLLVLGGQTLLERAASRLRPIVSRIVVAGGSEAATVRASLTGTCVGMSGNASGGASPGMLGQTSSGTSWEVFGDTFLGGGPLAGIHAALAATGDTCVVVGCDMPFFSVELLAFMEQGMGDALVAVPQVGPYFEPLHAIYRPECGGHIHALFEGAGASAAGTRTSIRGPQGHPRVTDLFSRVKVYVAGEDVVRQSGDPRTIFFNINEPGDYEAALRAVEVP